MCKRPNQRWQNSNLMAGNFGQAVGAADLFGRNPTGTHSDADGLRTTLEELK